MTETVKGRVQAISPKSQKDHIGLKLQVHDKEKWFNGNDEDVPSMSKGDFIEVEHSDGWIHEIDIIEEDNEDAQSVHDSNTGNGGEGSNSSKSSSQHLSERQAGIIATASVNQARDTVTTSYEDNKQKHLERVDELSQAYNNIMKDRMRENTQ